MYEAAHASPSGSSETVDARGISCEGDAAQAVLRVTWGMGESCDTRGGSPVAMGVVGGAGDARGISRVTVGVG